MSAASAEPVWSDLQLSWLQAMGHIVYLDRTAVVDVPVAEVVAVGRASAVEPSRPSRPTAPMTPRRAAPRAPAATATDQAAVSPVRRARAGLPDRLQIALLRASGCNPSDPQTQKLMASWPLDALRADPAAKRALWPQLRALRRRPLP